jgi:hypothetical protein
MYLHINIASKSNITECIHQARQFKETLPKKENYINVDASNPEAVDAWLNKKSHQLSTAISLDTKQQKTTAQVVELLVTDAVVPLADLQRVRSLVTYDV